jgi:hypothetical protein
MHHRSEDRAGRTLFLLQDVAAYSGEFGSLLLVGCPEGFPFSLGHGGVAGCKGDEMEPTLLSEKAKME